MTLPPGQQPPQLSSNQAISSNENVASQHSQRPGTNRFTQYVIGHAFYRSIQPRFNRSIGNLHTHLLKILRYVLHHCLIHKRLPSNFVGCLKIIKPLAPHNHRYLRGLMLNWTPRTPILNLLKLQIRIWDHLNIFEMPQGTFSRLLYISRINTKVQRAFYHWANDFLRPVRQLVTQPLQDVLFLRYQQLAVISDPLLLPFHWMLLWAELSLSSLVVVDRECLSFPDSDKIVVCLDYRFVFRLFCFLLLVLYHCMFMFHINIIVLGRPNPKPTKRKYRRCVKVLLHVADRYLSTIH